MTEQRHEGPGESAAPVPRDMQDQQAHGGEDRWDAHPAAEGAEDETAADVPDTDEAGTGRQGAPHSGSVHPEHPIPDESPA